MPEAAAVTAAFLAAYILGSVPSAWLFAKLAGSDIFRTGSGNMGAMNTLRHVGMVPGLLTLAADVLKGVLALQVAAWLAAASAPGVTAVRDLALGAAAFAAGLGHVFPAFTRFRGGKALAVAFGVLLFGHAAIALGGLVLIGLLTVLLRNVNLASWLTVAAAGLAVLAQELLQPDGSPAQAAGIALLALLIVLKHVLPATASGRTVRPGPR
ncbi:MAG TPA: glycerol-3-phosphate acyltransferase [Deinococcales bacterium]|nr:glycerol-3-phosphate acyltransferase [Deinococcales bacterium]